MVDVVQLVPRCAGIDENGNGTGSVTAWLRNLADQIDGGDFGDVAAAVIVLREDKINTGSTFCLRTRRCNMNFVEQAGSLQIMHHDMLHGGN